MWHSHSGKNEYGDKKKNVKSYEKFYIMKKYENKILQEVSQVAKKSKLKSYGAGAMASFFLFLFR